MDEPERIHHAVMPEEELDVAAQLRRIHPLEDFQVHSPALIADIGRKGHRVI
jgi:hypothetical protein